MHKNKDVEPFVWLIALPGIAFLLAIALLGIAQPQLSAAEHKEHPEIILPLLPPKPRLAPSLGK